MGSPVRYTLRIVPVFYGQTPRTAIDGNPVLFEKFGISGISYQYSPAQPQFSLFPDAVGFVWQIQASDLQNKPAARNNGKSEIFTFRFDAATPDGKRNGSQSGDLSSGSGGGTSLGNGGGSLGGNAQTQYGTSAVETGILSAIIGQFKINLDKSIICKGECIIDGGGKIYVNFLRDSVAVQFSGLTIRRSVLGATVISGEITARLSVSKRFRFDATELDIISLRWTPESAFFSGNCSVDWSEIGLGGGVEQVLIENADITPEEIPFQTRSVALHRNGRDTGFGECLALDFDSLSFAVSSQKIFAGVLHGEASLPCIATSDGTARGGFALSLDKPDAANLLITLQTSIRNAHLPDLPIYFSADKLLLDLTSEANFAALATPNSCLYADSWSNPLWRGIIIPNGQFSIVTDAQPIVFSAQNALLEPVQGGLALSLKSVEVRQQLTKLGGFRLALDTVAVGICRQAPQLVKLSGKIFLPESLIFPQSATNFDKISASLTADGRWNWHGIIESRPKSRLTFGKYGAIEFSRGTVSLLSVGKSMIEWTESALLPANTDEPISIAGLKITADGTIKFGNNGWASIAPAKTAEISGLPIAANEIGIGYGDEGWWFGTSGIIQMPEESGISASGGIKIKRLRIYENEKLTPTSDEVSQTIFAGKNLDISGNFRFGAIPDAGFGLIGRPNATFHSVGAAKLSVEFALGKSNGRLFWYATGTTVFPEPPAFAQSFSLFGGTFGAGWNIALSHCDSSSVENTSLISAPQIIFTELPFSIRAGLLIGETSRRLIRMAATAVNPMGTTPGTLKNYLEISGNAVIHPEFGFAHGYLSGQLTAANAPLQLTGTATLNFTGNTFNITGLSVASGANTPTIKFNGINGQLTLFEKFDKNDRNAPSAAMQCIARNATLTVTPDEVKFGGVFEPLLATGGASSHNTAGYIIAKGELSPCLRLLFTQNNTSATMDFTTFYKHEGGALAGLDVLPCAGALSVASAGSLAEQHRRDGGIWEFQPLVSGSDCGAGTLSVFASVSAAIRRTVYAEIHETTLRTAENQSAAISFPAWNDALSAGLPNVKIAALFAGDYWEFEQNAPSFRSCDDIAAARVGAVENCDIAPVISSNVYAIRNTGTNEIAQGSRIAFSLIFEADGKKNVVDTIMELKRNLPPQSEYTIEIKNYIANANRISGATLSVRTIAPLIDINSRNDCISIGSLVCPK